MPRRVRWQQLGATFPRPAEGGGERSPCWEVLGGFQHLPLTHGTERAVAILFPTPFDLKSLGRDKPARASAQPHWVSGYQHRMP